MPRYTDNEVEKITRIQLDMISNKIPFKVGEQNILEINSGFPVHNLKSYNNNLKKYLSGIGCYGHRSLPANWAKALLETTDNDLLVIAALLHQQELYLEKDGKVNKRLAALLDSI